MFWKIISMLRDLLTGVTGMLNDSETSDNVVQNLTDGNGLQVIFSSNITLNNVLLYSVKGSGMNTSVTINGKNFNLGYGSTWQQDAPVVLNFPFRASSVKISGTNCFVCYKPM